MALFLRGGDRAFHRHPEMGARTFRKQLERSAVGVGELTGDVEPEAGSTGSGREKRLEDLSAQLGGDSGTVVGQLANHGVTHVARARGDADAGVLFFAGPPRRADEG